MAVTHETPLRNALADGTNAYVNTGSGTAVVRLRESTTAVVNFNLQNPAFGSASNGVITLAGVPISAQAVAAGVVDNGQMINRNSDLAISCSVTGTGGGGDIEVSNVNIADEQDCELTSLTYAAPA